MKDFLKLVFAFCMLMFFLIPAMALGKALFGPIGSIVGLCVVIFIILRCT